MKYTVGTLIEELRKLDKNLPVVIAMESDEGQSYNLQSVDVLDASRFEGDKKRYMVCQLWTNDVK